MHLHSAFILVTLIQLGGAFPVSGLAIQLPPGHTYTYNYITHVTFNEPDVPTSSQAKKDVGLKLTAKVSLIPVFAKGNKMLVKLMLLNPQIESVARPDKDTQLRTLSRYPILAHLEGTEFKQVYAAEKDPTWSINIKKGILTLLQVQRESGTKEEVDASGQCTAAYKAEGLTLTEIKTDCKTASSSNQFSSPTKLLGVDVTSSVETKYSFSSDDVIQSVTSEERHVSRLHVRENVAARVISTQSLTLEKKELGATAVQASTVEEAAQVINAREKLKLQGSTLATTPENQYCDVANCDKLPHLVESLGSALRGDAAGPVVTNEAFLTLITALRFADQNAITAMLNDPKNDGIIPHLVDATVAAQTPAGQGALAAFLNFDEEYDFTLQERYLLAVAFSTHPPESLVRYLYELYKRNVKNPTLRESIGDALGAVMFTYCQIQDNCQHKVIQEARDLILERLQSCADANCQAQHLRILGNAGLPETLATLLHHAEHGSHTAICEAALKALRRLDGTLINDEVKLVLRKIYHQYRKPYDTAVRTRAAMLLLSHSPTDDDVREVLESTTDPDQSEHSMYIQQRLYQMGSRDKKFKSQVEEALKDVKLRNYHVLAPKGKALAFKENLAESKEIATTYDMYVQNSKAGIVKRSGMDVELTSSTSFMSFYSFGIFAAGLEGLLGEEVEAGQEEVEPTAGLALDLFGVALRPVTFFVGQSGLMSAVWNAPSELTNALQASLLLQDHQQTIGLQNGLSVTLNVKGAISIDLSGLISISLWNKNCHSLIKNSGSIVVRGTLGIRTPAFRAGVNYSADAASVMDFITDVDFYDKLKMCLQMTRPGVTYRHRVTKYERAYGFKTAYKATLSRRSHFQGVCYPLPKPNNEQCRVLLADQA